MISAQAPQLIAYQAVARDNNGEPIVSANLQVRFTIRNQAATGNAIWTEVQEVATNTQGLFNTKLGINTSLSSVDWGDASKFLQVELFIDNSFFDVGTQQLLSVPYALFANSVNFSVSPIGDTLVIGNGAPLIIPGLSALNPPVPDGLPHTCGLEGVHNEDVTYGSVTDVDGNVYKTIVVSGMEWMAENLNVGHFQNGSLIGIVEDNTSWNTPVQSPFSCYYQNQMANACPYGRIYNFYAVTDSRGLCPVGWHVPDNYEWQQLHDALGGTSVAGGAMKTEGTVEANNGLWYSPNTAATNASGFSAVPGGYRSQFGVFTQKGYGAYYWANQSAGGNDGWFQQLNYNQANATGNIFDGRFGASVRCMRDL
jgi:uncharacterized protein (TIGR02145 family)